MTRRHLRAPASVRVASELALDDQPRRRTIGLQHFEPRRVHRLERQRRLEPDFGRGIQLPRHLQGAVAIEAGPVTLKTQRPWTPDVAITVRRILQPRAARRTERFRPLAFELPAREQDPVVRGVTLTVFVVSSLQVTAHDAASIGRGCDRAGHSRPGFRGPGSGFRVPGSEFLVPGSEWFLAAGGWLHADVLHDIPARVEE